MWIWKCTMYLYSQGSISSIKAVTMLGIADLDNKTTIIVDIVPPLHHPIAPRTFIQDKPKGTGNIVTRRHHSKH